MTKENKIVKYELESEVDPLLDQGMSYQSIAEIIKNNHPDIIDLQDLSHMSIKRYKEGKIKIDTERKINDSGGNYVDTFLKEFRGAMNDLNNKTNDIYNRSIRLLNKLELEENNDTTLKAIKEVTNSVEQLRKNWTSLAQYGIRQTSNIYNINLKKEQNTKILLLNWSKKLCPACRLEVSKYFEDDVEENKEV